MKAHDGIHWGRARGRAWGRLSPRGLLAVLLLLPAAAPAQEILTPHHVARIRSVTEAVIAPDGKHVAYALTVPRRPLEDDDGPPWAELHVAGPDGTSRGFVTGKVNVSRIAWKPDGSGISFLARRGDDKESALYVISIDGGEARKAVGHETSITGYSWSPDGRRVAFLAAQAVPEARRKLKEKGFNQEIYEEDTPFIRVWIAEDFGGEQKPRILDLTGSASELHWSPVDGRLAMALAPTPLVDDDLMQRRVHIVEADTGRVVARLQNPGKLGRLAWSPDGRNIAMISAADLNDPNAGRLMASPSTGGELRDLLPGCACDVSAFGWKDAGTLLFVADEGVGTTVGEVGLDGSGRKTLVPAGRAVLTAVSLSRDGLGGAFIGQSPVHPPELFRMNQGESDPRRVTESNPWLSKIRLAKQEAVTYKARDGLELEGLLIRPLDERSGEQYPLILVAHGGPESHYSNGWLTGYSLPGQVAAAGGFAVFYPNYRGSTGRGVAFSKLGQGDPAGKEFDDLVDGVDHLVNTGLAQRAKVGITGGSYGGYASAWGATYYSDRFAASVMFVGISDEISKIGTTDISMEMYHVHFRYWPWEKWQHVLERSPIFHAGKSRTPTLILGGKDDPRVHPSQSLEMYRYLKLHGKAPVRLVRYPGEQHGNRRSASRLDYNLRMMQWLEHYLKGPGGAPPPRDLDYEEPSK